MHKKLLTAASLALLTLGAGPLLKGHCQTQLEMNGEANGRADEADKKLNITYKKVTQQFHSNKDFLTKLVTAEKAWISYRDAYLKSVFPEENQYDAYGTMFPMCRAIWLASITEERTKQLEKYLAVKKAAGNAEVAFKTEEKVLNEVWPKVLKVYESQYVKHLRHAEITWLAYRDADANAFAALASAADAPNLLLARKADIDKERTKELTQWIDGVEEGVVCFGCIPFRKDKSSKIDHSQTQTVDNKHLVRVSRQNPPMGSGGSKVTQGTLQREDDFQPATRETADSIASSVQPLITGSSSQQAAHAYNTDDNEPSDVYRLKSGVFFSFVNEADAAAWENVRSQFKARNGTERRGDDRMLLREAIRHGYLGRNAECPSLIDSEHRVCVINKKLVNGETLALVQCPLGFNDGWMPLKYLTPIRQKAADALPPKSIMMAKGNEIELEIGNAIEKEAETEYAAPHKTYGFLEVVDSGGKSVYVRLLKMQGENVYLAVLYGGNGLIPTGRTFWGAKSRLRLVQNLNVANENHLAASHENLDGSHTRTDVKDKNFTGRAKQMAKLTPS